jgi:hypothetical protein
MHARKLLKRKSNFLDLNARYISGMRIIFDEPFEGKRIFFRI